MKFTPKTDLELKEENSKFKPWPDGIYAFTVREQVVLGTRTLTTEERVSKSGNDMIVLVLEVFANDDEKSIFLEDYLLESMAFKFKHAAEACGLLKQYESGEIKADDFIGKSGEVSLTIQKGQKKDDGSNYPDRNSVKDYIKASGGDVDLEDSITF